jgi:hypothetical protein
LAGRSAPQDLERRRIEKTSLTEVWWTEELICQRIEHIA